MPKTRSVDSTASLCERIAAYLVETKYEALPPDVVEAAKARLVHHLGLALRGGSTAEGRGALRFARELDRTAATSSVVGQTERFGSLAAVFANSVLVGHQGMDDGQLPSGSHPGLVVLPAALYAAEQEGSNGRDLLTAVVSGYDVLGKLARPAFGWQAISPRRPNMIFGPIGGAAAAARLMHLSASDTAHALAHAANASMTLVESSAVPWSNHLLAMNGLTAVLLARAKLPTAMTMLEGRNGLYRSFFGEVPVGLDTVLDELGHEFEIPSTIIRRWRTSGLNLNAVQLALELLESGGFNPAEVGAVTVVFPSERRERERMYEEAYARGANESLRVSSARIQVAMTLVDGRHDASRFLSEPDAVLAAMFDRVKLAFEDDRPILYTRLEVVLRGGRQFSATRESWDARHFEFPRSAWDSWLLESAEGVVAEDQARTLGRLIRDLEQLEDARELIACLVPRTGAHLG